MIELSDISFSLDGKNILSNVSFKLLRGKSLIIIGPNGAGKSTLLKVLSGFFNDYEGEVFIRGKNLRGFNPYQLSREISYIPQVYSLTFDMEVYDFLLFSRFPHKGLLKNYSQIDLKKVDEVSNKLGISVFLERKMNSLSGGELQKVMLASALVQESEIILLDEPVTFLDPSSQVEVYNLLLKLKNEGKTLIVVSHDLNVFSFFSGDVLGLKDGKKTFYLEEGKYEDMTKYLEKIFNVKFFKMEKNGRVFFNFDV